MANKKDIKPIELSKKAVEEMMIEAKYLNAADTFNFNITEDIRDIVSKMNRKKSCIESLYMTFIALDEDLDKYSMQAKQTLFTGFFQDSVNRDISQLMQCKKILTVYYKYLDYGLITPIEDIYNKVISILRNSDYVEKAYKNHTNFVLDGDILFKYNFNISKKYFESLKSYLNNEIPSYEMNSINEKYIEKIKFNTAIEANIDLKRLNDINYYNLLEYMVSNKNSIIDIFKIYLTMVHDTGLTPALNYMKEFIIPYTLEGININDISLSLEVKALDILDFINKSCNLNEELYTLKVYDSRNLEYDLSTIVKNFGRDTLPDEAWLYVEEATAMFDKYKDELDNGDFPDELADEEFALNEDFIMDMHNMSRFGVDITRIRKYDSPFLKEDYFIDTDNIENVNILNNLDEYSFDIGLICVHSEKIDLFIKNNIKNDDKLNEMLMTLEKLFAIYCESSYTMSTPKIITKESSLFHNEITSEYLIISSTTYNGTLDKTLGQKQLSNKIIGVSDYDTIKSVLNVNKTLKEILL